MGLGFKHGVALAALTGIGLAIFGLPAPRENRAPNFATDIAVLPMRFAHSDHKVQPCASCHHEFVDRRQGPPCMNCHMTDPTVAPVLEQQFHQLCQSCHVETGQQGKATGPARHCRACHQTDQEF